MLSHTHNSSDPQESKVAKRRNPFYVAQEILSRRDHSEFEVTAKLKRKGFNTAQIQPVMTWLREKKLVNDASFAEKYTQSVLDYKKVGPMWIKQKLRQKSVPAVCIEDALAKLLSPSQEVEIARQAADAWRRLHPAHKNDRNRLTRFLASRGFSSQAIYKT